MKVSLCTITFRHQLASLPDIAGWARTNDFQGIELWGIHARNLMQHTAYDAAFLADCGLSVPMVSDYLPTDGDAHLIEQKATEMAAVARHWRAHKVRTFAGRKGSLETRERERAGIIAGLRRICGILADHGQFLVVETHPNTLADSTASTAQLIKEVSHPALRINFDVLHVWEGGDDVATSHSLLKPWIAHYHLKNIRSRADLALFEPNNVYAASGRREGLTPLFEGKVDFPAFLDLIAGDEAVEGSLEWFGDDAFDVLAHDRRELRIALLNRKTRAPEHAG